MKDFRKVVAFEENFSKKLSFFDEIQLIKGWAMFVLRLYKSYLLPNQDFGGVGALLADVDAGGERGGVHFDALEVEIARGRGG